jgi:hypothetical protein
LSPEEFEKLDKIVREYLRTSRPKFLRAIALQFANQYHAGQIPDWPPQFVTRPDIDEGKQKSRGSGKKPPGPAQKKST